LIASNLLALKTIALWVLNLVRPLRGIEMRAANAMQSKNKALIKK
jgi:hypothetical protein